MPYLALKIVDVEDANLTIVIAQIAPPPGYERAYEAPPAAPDPFVLQMVEPGYGPKDRAHIQRLAGSAVVSAVSVDAGRTDALTERRLVSGFVPMDRAITEAVADQSAQPVAAIGRITAWFGGSQRTCTGTVIAERLVLTAAHCVHAKGAAAIGAAQYADWIRFEPQYRPDRPRGQWRGEAVYVQQGWSDPQPGTLRSHYDYALIRLDAPIAHVSGTAALMLGGEVDGPITALGYPRIPVGPYSFDGEFLYATTGPQLPETDKRLMRAQNGLTEGSSGGPWLAQVEGQVRLVGLNSMKPKLSDDETWSPRLGPELEAMIARALSDMTGV